MQVVFVDLVFAVVGVQAIHYNFLQNALICHLLESKISDRLCDLENNDRVKL